MVGSSRAILAIGVVAVVALVLSHSSLRESADRQAQVQRELDALMQQLAARPVAEPPGGNALPVPIPPPSPPPPPFIPPQLGGPPAPVPVPAQAPPPAPTRTKRPPRPRPLSGFTALSSHLTAARDRLRVTQAGGVGGSDPGLADEWGTAVVGDTMEAGDELKAVSYYAEFSAAGLLPAEPGSGGGGGGGGAVMVGLVEANRVGLLDSGSYAAPPHVKGDGWMLDPLRGEQHHHDMATVIFDPWRPEDTIGLLLTLHGGGGTAAPRLSFFRNGVRQDRSVSLGSFSVPLCWAVELKGVGTSVNIQLTKYAPPPPPPPQRPKARKEVKTAPMPKIP